MLKCTEVLYLIKSMHLPLDKPRWAEFTDAEPSVGLSNFEVSFRDAELARIYSSVIIAFGFIGPLAIADRTKRKGQDDGLSFNPELLKEYSSKSVKQTKTSQVHHTSKKLLISVKHTTRELSSTWSASSNGQDFL